MRGALWWQMGGACPEGSTFPHLQVRRTRCKICCWSLCRFLTLSRLCPGSVAGGLQAQGGLEVQDAMMVEQLSASSSVTVPSGGLTLDGGKIGVNEALPEATLDASAVPEIGQIAFTGRGSSALDITGAYTESTSRSFTLTITHALHTCKDLCADNTYVACAGDALCQVTEAGCAAVDACEANLPSDATEAAGACEQSAACAFQPQTAQWSSCVAHAVPAVCDAGSTFIFSSGVASSLAFGLSATIDYRFVASHTHTRTVCALLDAFHRPGAESWPVCFAATVWPQMVAATRRTRSSQASLLRLRVHLHLQAAHGTLAPTHAAKVPATSRCAKQAWAGRGTVWTGYAPEQQMARIRASKRPLAMRGFRILGVFKQRRRECWPRRTQQAPLQRWYLLMGRWSPAAVLRSQVAPRWPREHCKSLATGCVSGQVE